MGLHAEILVRVVHKCRMFEKELKMAGYKTNIQFGPFCSLYQRQQLPFSRIITMNNQLVVTPNETVGLYYRY